MDILNGKEHQETKVEQQFQKKIVKHTIDSFCKYLKGNGYSIVKTNQAGQFSGTFDLSAENEDTPDDERGSLKETKIENREDMSNRKMKQVNCPHRDRKHYAKNMCYTCYHKLGREKKAWLCPHTYKTHYARGKCRNCYINFYHKVSPFHNYRNNCRKRKVQKVSLTHKMYI